MRILDEETTLKRALAGQSLARYGDGELSGCFGKAIKSQDGNARLAELLREPLVHPNPYCIVGITRLDGRSPKVAHARRCLGGKYRGLYQLPSYGSAYITRPDCAPWIDTPEYWALVKQLWQDQDVVVVRGSTKSLIGAELAEDGARSVEEIVAPRHNGFDAFDDLFVRLRGEFSRRVLLCLGPTATVLAWKLSWLGVHAIDCGHIGLFHRKAKKGLHPWLA